MVRSHYHRPMKKKWYFKSVFRMLGDLFLVIFYNYIRVEYDFEPIMFFMGLHFCLVLLYVTMLLVVIWKLEFLGA